jgi:protein HIRA/HIR1
MGGSVRVRAGSQDCGLSVWSTETTRPKLVTKNIFSQSVLDIAWAPDGYTLLCCSTDGTAVSLHFDPKEVRHDTRHTTHDTRHDTPRHEHTT